MAVLVRCAYELELCTKLLEAGDPFDLPRAVPYLQRAADAVARLQVGHGQWRRGAADAARALIMEAPPLTTNQAGARLGSH